MVPEKAYPFLADLLSPFWKRHRKTLALVIAAIAATGQARSFAIATTLARWLKTRLDSAVNRFYRLLRSQAWRPFSNRSEPVHEDSAENRRVRHHRHLVASLERMRSIAMSEALQRRLWTTRQDWGARMSVPDNRLPQGVSGQGGLPGRLPVAPLGSGAHRRARPSMGSSGWKLLGI